MVDSEKLDAKNRKILNGEFGNRVFAVAGMIGLSAIGLSFVIGLTLGDGLRHFWFAYLVAFAFVLSLSLGAFFFVILQHLTQSSWSVVVRRVAELVAGNIYLVAILFIPVIFNLSAYYPWAEPVKRAADELLIHKMPHLTKTWFVTRFILYFAIWGFLARHYLGRSLAQDKSGDVKHTLRMRNYAAPAMLIFAVTLNFAAFDLIMSLDPHWFSSIFGVYFFAASGVGFSAFFSLLVLFLQGAGKLETMVTTEHYHDLAKFLFAFTFFWVYIAFSQYMLIWYANLPEETTWYFRRQQDGWAALAIFLLAGHFAIPFLALLMRKAKRNKIVLGMVAAWMLLMHWLDLYWLIMPELNPEGIDFHILDLLCWIGLFGIFIAGAGKLVVNKSLVPVKDPKLAESLAFRNAP